MRILALDAALAGCSAALVADGVVIAERRAEGSRQAAGLATMAAAVIGEGVALVAVTVGPGSFTGLRAALSLAHGIGLACGVEVVGVTVAEALAEALPALGGPALGGPALGGRALGGRALGGRALWVAIDSSRGRIFLDTGDGMRAVRPEALPPPPARTALAGDAAPAVAAALAARGADVMLTDARLPLPRYIAMVAQRRAAGELPPLPAQPLYVDPPEAHASPQRPPPQ